MENFFNMATQQLTLKTNAAEYFLINKTSQYWYKWVELKDMTDVVPPEPKIHQIFSLQYKQQVWKYVISHYY